MEPRKKITKKELIRRILLVISSAVFVVCLAILGKYYWDSYQNKLLNDSLKNIKPSSSESVSSQPEEKDSHNLKALKEQNPETRAFITIPGTNIEYVVLQSDDNDKYLHVDFNGNKVKDGSIFFDYRVKLDPLSQNTVVYGHNMKDGQMFGQLEKFERFSGNDYINFYNQNHIIKLDTLDGEYDYKIFAVVVTTSDYNEKNHLYYLDIDFDTPEKFDTFISDIKKRSFINTDIDVTSDDKIITLSACDYHYPQSKDGDHARLVVFGKLMKDGESYDITPATANKDVLFPDFYHDVWNKK